MIALWDVAQCYFVEVDVSEVRTASIFMAVKQRPHKLLNLMELMTSSETI
jgi:hypothetical protein